MVVVFIEVSDCARRIEWYGWMGGGICRGEIGDVWLMLLRWWLGLWWLLLLWFLLLL